jgi:hypothetical protein
VFISTLPLVLISHELRLLYLAISHFWSRSSQYILHDTPRDGSRCRYHRSRDSASGTRGRKQTALGLRPLSSSRASMLDSLLLRQSHDGRDNSFSPSMSKLKTNAFASVASPPRWQTRSPSSGWDLSSSPGLSYGSLRSSSSIPSGSRRTSVDYPSFFTTSQNDRHILPSIPSSSSMSDEELPPLTSDYDVSEFSEELQLDTDDDSEDITHRLSPRKTFFAVSSERGQWQSPSFVPNHIPHISLPHDGKSSELRHEASQGLRIERHLRIADLLSAPEPNARMPTVQEAPLVSTDELSRDSCVSSTPHNDEDIFAQNFSSPSSPLPPSSPPVSPTLVNTTILPSDVDESPSVGPREPQGHFDLSATAIEVDDRVSVPLFAPVNPNKHIT